MPTPDDFHRALSQIFNDRTAAAAPAVTVTSGDLHRLVGGYPGPNHAMPTCCAVMRQAMSEPHGDRVIPPAPPKGNGATLRIRYTLPRP